MGYKLHNWKNFLRKGACSFKTVCLYLYWINFIFIGGLYWKMLPQVYIYSFSEMTKLLVVGSYQRSISVEIVNFDTSNPGLKCQNLPNLPAGISGGVGFLYAGQIPIMCGLDSWAYHCSCFALRNGVWNFVPAPSVCTWYPAAALIDFPNFPDSF